MKFPEPRDRPSLHVDLRLVVFPACSDPTLEIDHRNIALPIIEFFSPLICTNLE